MSSKPLAISAHGLTKVYRIGVTQHATLLSEAIWSRLRGRGGATSREFRALDDVSFEVFEGDVVGVIGRNGAGKSTLLKLLSRITEPTSGRAELYGRTGSLLEVGTGFHPELTGRENIFLNGSILGMSRADIRKQFDAIVEFAGVSTFLDTPVKRFSSGMYVRLAFAVSAFLNPDILIVDEVLAVGDAEFQRKCLGKMRDVAGQGRTVMFVSHNMAAVQGLCNRGLVLGAGRLLFDGDVSGAIEAYRNSTAADATSTSPGEFDFSDHECLYEGGASMIKRVRLLNSEGTPTDTVLMGEPLVVEVDVEGMDAFRASQFSVIFKGETGQWLSNFNTGMKLPRLAGERQPRERVTLRIDSLPYVPGEYLLDFSLAMKGSGRLDAVENSVMLRVEPSDVYGTGYGPKTGEGVLYTVGDWEIGPR